MQRSRHEVHEVRHFSKGPSNPPFTSSNNNRQNRVKFANTTANFNSNSSDGGLRQTMKKQAEESLKDTRSASQSEKFEYGSKLREKKNYVYYVSGVGYVTKEEEEEKPKPVVKKEEETYIERKHIIDNYQYHETKNIRKANKTSNVFHRRLAQPFEVTEQIKTKKGVPYSEVVDQKEIYEVPLKSRNVQKITTQKKYNVTVPNRRIRTPVNQVRNKPKQEITEEVYEMKEGYGNENEQIYDDVPANEYYYYQEKNETKGQGQGPNYGFYESKSTVTKNQRGGQTTTYLKRGRNTYESKRGNSSFSGPSGRKEVVTTTTTTKRRGYVASPYQGKNVRK